MEIQVGMLRADMVKNARDRPPDAGIETLHRIDVDSVANIFVAGMLHGLMFGKALADGHECLRLITHQMRVGSDLCFNRTFGSAQRKTGHDRGTRVTGRSAGRDVGRPLHHRHDRRFLRIRLTFPAPSRRWVIRPLSGTSPEMEMVDLNRAVEHVFPRHHQPQCVTHAPGRRLAHSKDLGEPDQDKPLSDWSISHMAFSQTRKGSLVECRGVWVVTVNWNRQSPLEH